MNTTTATTGVRHEVSKAAITLDKIYEGNFQKEGTLTAQIRQVVTTKSFYPSKKVDSSLQANIFSIAEFGFAEQEFTSTENRVAWIPVPKNITKEAVEAKLAAVHANGGTIYRVLSSAPILDENQKYGISQGLVTMDDFANSQAVRYPEGTQKDGADVSGKLTLDKEGKVQYRRTFFWLTPMDDQDARGQVEPYLSAELKAELAGASVMQGQTI